MGINYVDKNGDRTEVFKNKDINRAIKGECKIYVDGNEEYTEVFTENLLTNNVLYEMIAKQLTEQTKIDNYIEHDKSVKDIHLNLIHSDNCFNSIMLGYSEVGEDARFDHVQGIITGFSDFDTSVDSTNNLEGYSLFSTDYRDGKITLECSFSSSKINNNLINQVWVGTASQNREGSSKGGQMINFFRQYNVNPMNDVKQGVGVFAYNKLFIADGNRCYIYNLYITENRVLNLELYLECELPADTHTFCYNREHDLFYIQNNKTVYVMTFDKKFTVLSQKTVNFSLNIASFGSNLICAKNYFEGFYDEVKKVFIYDKNFNLITSFNLPSTLKGKPSHVETNWDEDYIFLFTSDLNSPSFIYVLDKNLNIISYVISDYNSNHFSLDGFTKIQFNTKNMFYANKGIYKASINHSTQTKLAKTVEKNFGQSMRVSYSFIFTE